MRSSIRTVTILAAVVVAATGCSAESGDAGQAGGDASPAAAAPTKRAVVQHKKVRIEKPIPFAARTVSTADLDKGVRVVQQQGRRGVRVRVVRVTTENGAVTSRDVVRTYVDQAPVDRVTLVGTHVDAAPKQGSGCDPNYSGACVPIASDVDCAGGSGDGPAYVQGPVRVVGDDIYDLNRDDDDIACDG